MIFSRKWRNLALAMLTVTILCNLLVLKQMPDSSSRSIRAVSRPQEQHSGADLQVFRENISRKLGSTTITSSSSSGGVLKRWVLGRGRASKQHDDPRATQSSQAVVESHENSSEIALDAGSSEQLYMNHPRFGQQNSAARSASKQAAQDSVAIQENQKIAADTEVGDIAGSLNSTVPQARPQNLVQLSEAFRQQQEEVAAAVKATGKPPEVKSSTQAPPEKLNRAPGVLDALQGAISAPKSPLSQDLKGLPAQIVPAYPGLSLGVQQQDAEKGGDGAGTAEEHAAFSSVSGHARPGTQQAVPQQVLADVDTNPKAPVDQGEQAAPALQKNPQQQLPVAQNLTADPSCFDEEAGCPAWAEGDGCISTGPAFMLEKCRRSCGVCSRPYVRRTADKVELNNGVMMPLVGFGTAGLGPNTKQAVKWALEAGYRLLDSAQAQEWYREDLVGQAIIESGFPREELFLTSKLHPRHHGYDTAMIQFTKSLASLAVEQVDLFLLHYPACWPELCGADVAPAGRWQDSWRALETLVDKGLVRAIGVSNFNVDELAELLAMARIKPALVQQRSDPLSADFATQALCALSGIQYQGYSTLGSQWLRQGHVQNLVLDNAIVQAIAAEVGRDAAQVVLKWALQHGQAVVPRSSKQERIAANRVLDFELSDKQMRRMDALDSIVTLEAVRR